MNDIQRGLTLLSQTNNNSTGGRYCHKVLYRAFVYRVLRTVPNTYERLEIITKDKLRTLSNSFSIINPKSRTATWAGYMARTEGKQDQNEMLVKTPSPEAYCRVKKLKYIRGKKTQGAGVYWIKLAQNGHSLVILWARKLTFASYTGPDFLDQQKASPRSHMCHCSITLTATPEAGQFNNQGLSFPHPS